MNMEPSVNTVMATIILGMLNVVRYYVLHVLIPNILDDLFFDPIIQLIEDDDVVNGELPGPVPDDNNSV